MFPVDLAIFVPLDWRWAQCSHVCDERLAGGGLALGDLVLVVREDQVDPAGVDVEGLARGGPCSSPSTRCASPAGLRRSPSTTTARRAWGPSTARSRGRRPWRTRRPRPARRPAAARGPGGRGGRTSATRRSGRRSSRRRSGRRDRASSSVAISATISSMCSVARGSTSGRVIRRVSASSRKRSR